MIEFTDYSKEINQSIENVKKKVLSGKISLLNLELNPIFQDLKDSLNIFNINKYSELYKEACSLLNQKFEELKAFLKLLESDKLFFNFLNSKYSDSEISDLFKGCWRQIFDIENASIKFLEASNQKYSKEKDTAIHLEHLKKQYIDKEFLVKIPSKNYTERIIIYFNKIKSKLPCRFEDIFEDDKDQIQIFENFVYLLHLLQLGKIKYQKETKTLYL
ncbi:MAG: hypothetical protein ACFE78_01395 [Candidatus Hodarchaeota archaeon]